MTLITKLSNERLDELTALRLEKGLSNIVTVLDSSELENYMVNINDAIERTSRNMLKYTVGGTAYNSYKGMTEGLEVLKQELQDRINSELAVEEVVTDETNVELVEVADLTDLTEKEKEVLQAIVNESYEYGLGMESSDLDCTVKGKSLSGVISSLTKKGYVEGYLDGRSFGHDDFFNLTEEWFEKLVGEYE